MKISIALCTYNGAKYIAEQLESLARQTVGPFELVVCDDGSTDDTLKIIREFASRVPFEIRIFENEENLQFTGNFLKAASLCTGDYIAFCDQDDVWEVEKIGACISALEDRKADLLIHEGRVIDGNGRPVGLKIPDFSGGLDDINNPPFDRASKGFAMVVRRQVVQEIMNQWSWGEYITFKRTYGPPLGHDLLIYAWCLERKKIAYLQQELVQYRIHGENVTASVAITKGIFSRFLEFFRGLALDKTQYSLPAEKWAAEVKFLGDYLGRSMPENYPGLERLSQWLERKARLWMQRSIVYDRKIGRFAKWRAVASLLFAGGYVSLQEPRLGFCALSKDIIIPVISLKAKDEK